MMSSASPAGTAPNGVSGELTFEQAYQELAQIVSRLETGNLSLSDSLALFERGQQLARLCETQLETAELRISQVTAMPDLNSDTFEE